jgi:hypothetical protein
VRAVPVELRQTKQTEFPGTVVQRSGAAGGSAVITPPGPLLASVSTRQYNAHRIYGLFRLPLMTANWEVLEVLEVYKQKYRAGECGVQTCDDLFAHWQGAAPLGATTGCSPSLS